VVRQLNGLAYHHVKWYASDQMAPPLCFNVSSVCRQQAGRNGQEKCPGENVGGEMSIGECRTLEIAYHARHCRESVAKLIHVVLQTRCLVSTFQYSYIVRNLNP